MIFLWGKDWLVRHDVAPFVDSQVLSELYHAMFQTQDN